MKRTVLVASALALIVPGSAAAKEISKLEACGAGDCNSTSDRQLLLRIGEGSNGDGSGPTPPLQPFYRLTYTVSPGPGEHFPKGATDSFTTYYVPGARTTSSIDEHGNARWLSVSPEFARALRRLTRGMDPFPAPTIDRVTVDGRPVADPASYARLLTIRGEDPGFVDAADWEALRFHSRRPSPWTGDAIAMLFSPSAGLLSRDYRYLRLPAEVAAALRDRDALPAGRDSGFPAWAYGFIAVAWAGIAAAIVALIRRRPKGGAPSVAESAS